jgi:hypothetical protein
VKGTRLLFNLLAALEHNFDVVDPYYYLSIMQTLTSDLYSQHRMIKVARLLQTHAIALLRRVVAEDAELPPKADKVFS